MQKLRIFIVRILNYLDRNTLKKCLTILLSCSVLALIFAYVSQYFFGLEPCILCFHQRKPFYFVAILAFLGRFLIKKRSRQKLIILLSVSLLIVNAGIAFFHAGVEKKFFKGPTGCSSLSLEDVQDVQELARIIESTSAIRCDEPKFYFLGITMAGWNFLYCISLIIMISWLYLRFEMRKKLTKPELDKAN